MTNFEWIKSMDIETLSKFLNSLLICEPTACEFYTEGCAFNCPYSKGADILYRYLNKEHIDKENSV